MTTLRSYIFAKYPKVAKHLTKVFGYISAYTFKFVHENSRQEADFIGRSLEYDSVSFFQDIEISVSNSYFIKTRTFRERMDKLLGKKEKT